MIVTSPSKINRVLLDPSVSPYVHDDGGFSEIDTEQCLYLMPDEDSLFVFQQRNYITLEVHAAILPSRRKYGRIDGLRAFDWVFSCTHFEKIIASIPVTNRLSVIFARSNGLKKEGYSPKSFKLDGELIDMINYGITKQEFLEEILCRQS